MMVPELPTQSARIGAVLTLIGTLVWVQWPVDFEEFNIPEIIFFIVALGTWMSIEFAEFRKESKSTDHVLVEDVDKFNKLISLIDREQYYILRNKAIQTNMDGDDYQGLMRLIHFREGDIFPFHNPKIQAAYEAFCDQVYSFYMEFYGLYTSDGRGRSTWKPSDERWVEEEIYKKVMSKIAVLDRKASSLADSWESLISLSRQELKGASKAVDRYDT